MFERLRGSREAVDVSMDDRVAALERRVAELEDLLEALQDSVHREAVRRDEQALRLERKVEPRELARALSEDARKRGL
jgi:uncharacterized coiled-coil protein SlyX